MDIVLLYSATYSARQRAAYGQVDSYGDVWRYVFGDLDREFPGGYGCRSSAEDASVGMAGAGADERTDRDSTG